jgi:hypothetical protein
MVRTAVLSIALPLLLATACAEPDDAAVGTTEQELFWWHDWSETLDAPFELQGPPVWSDDDEDAAAVLLRYQRRLSFPPLQGWWAKRDFRFELFLQQPGSRSRDYVSDEIEGRPTDLFYMRRAGYLLVQRWVPEVGIDYVVVDIATGTATKLEPVDTFDRTRDVIPSRDGAFIADVVCQPWQAIPTADGSRIEPLRPLPCEVSFLDAATLTPTGPATTVLLDDDVEVGQRRAAWSAADQLVVTDHATSAFALAPGAAPVAVAVPPPFGPVTSSSRVDAAGNRLGVGLLGNLIIE